MFFIKCVCLVKFFIFYDFLVLVVLFLFVVGEVVFLLLFVVLYLKYINYLGLLGNDMVESDIYIYYYLCCDVFDEVKLIGVEIGLCYVVFSVYIMLG